MFFSVYLPQVRSTLAALAIISFVGSWNDYEGPLIMLANQNLYTVPIGLTRFVDADGGLSAGLAMAASVSPVIPVLIVFLIFQRQFVAALANSGLKEGANVGLKETACDESRGLVESSRARPTAQTRGTRPCVSCS